MSQRASVTTIQGNKIWQALRDQDFTWKATKEGYIVMAPDGKSQVRVHRSSFTKKNRVGGPLLAELRSIGFRPELMVAPKEGKEKTPLPPEEPPPPSEEPEERLMTTKEVAEYVGVTTGAIGQAITAGKLQALPGQRGKDIPRVKESDAVAYKLNRHKKGTAAGPVRVRKMEAESPAVRVMDALKHITVNRERELEYMRTIEKNVTAMYEELRDLRQRMRNIEKVLGKAVENL